jgi:hypothetical protein
MQQNDARSAEASGMAVRNIIWPVVNRGPWKTCRRLPARRHEGGEPQAEGGYILRNERSAYMRWLPSRDVKDRKLQVVQLKKN